MFESGDRAETVAVTEYTCGVSAKGRKSDYIMSRASFACKCAASTTQETLEKDLQAPVRNRSIPVWESQMAE